MHNKKYRRIVLCRRGRVYETGSTLIPVLAVLVACSMIVTALLALSQLGTIGMTSHIRLQKSAYICEGAANRIQWLVAAERSRNPNTSLLNFDYSDSEHDRFIADGVEHTMDYHGLPVKFVLTDAAAGLDFSRRYRTATMRRMRQDPSADSEYLDKMEALNNLLTDYADSDDSTSENSWETDDYKEQKRAPLPRNAELQYREELFWLPGFTEMFPVDRYGRLSAVRIIPPTALDSVQTNTQQQQTTQGGGGGGSTGGQQARIQNRSLFTQNPNLFGAGDYYLKYVCNLEDTELAQIKEGIRLYLSERTPLTESIEGTLLTKLMNSLTWTQGSTVTAIIDPSGGENGPSKRLAVTWTVSSNISGPDDGVIRWLEWMFF